DERKKDRNSQCTAALCSHHATTIARRLRALMCSAAVAYGVAAGAKRGEIGKYDRVTLTEVLRFCHREMVCTRAPIFLARCAVAPWVRDAPRHADRTGSEADSRPPAAWPHSRDETHRSPCRAESRIASP